MDHVLHVPGRFDHTRNLRDLQVFVRDAKLPADEIHHLHHRKRLGVRDLGTLLPA